jgi:hypothetical protein
MEVTVPDGKRLGHVNVICFILITFVDRKEGTKRGNGDWVRGGPKVGQLTLSMGPARAEVCSYIQLRTS